MTIRIKVPAPKHRSEVAYDMMTSGKYRANRFSDRRNKRSKEKAWKKEDHNV